MLPLSLKNLGLTLGTALLIGAPALSQAAPTDFDDKSAVIFAYFAVGNDDNPSGSITTEQFNEQIEEISSGGYTVKPLPEIIDAFAAGKSLPDRTIALTFDGADRSVLENAIPLLEQKKLPYTIFIPSDRISSGKPPYMTWDDLRDLKDSKLVSFGLHPSSYSRLSGIDQGEIKRQINSSLSTIRDEMDIDVKLMAYPFGDYDSAYKSIAKSMGFKAAFGQQSGVAYAGDDRFALPRFTLTERYGDIDRFRMTANALPFPVSDISPNDPHLTSLTPAIGFTVPEGLSKSLKKSLSCFSSTDEKPTLEFMDSNRVELRMAGPLMEDRPRINCTLPVTPVSGEEPRWRWFGMLYTVPADLLEKEEMNQAAMPTKHAGDTSDSINME